MKFLTTQEKKLWIKTMQTLIKLWGSATSLTTDKTAELANKADAVITEFRLRR